MWGGRGSGAGGGRVVSVLAGEAPCEGEQGCAETEGGSGGKPPAQEDTVASHCNVTSHCFCNANVIEP